MAKKVTLSKGIGYARGNGVSDVALGVLKAHSRMGNMQGLRNAFLQLEEQIDTEYRPKVLDQVSAFRDQLAKGTEIESVHGEGYLLELGDPVLQRWIAAGYELSPERLAAAARRQEAARTAA